MPIRATMLKKIPVDFFAIFIVFWFTKMVSTDQLMPPIKLVTNFGQFFCYSSSVSISLQHPTVKTTAIRPNLLCFSRPKVFIGTFETVSWFSFYHQQTRLFWWYFFRHCDPCLSTQERLVIKSGLCTYRNDKYLGKQILFYNLSDNLINLMNYCYLSKIPVNWRYGDFNQLYCKSDAHSTS